MTRCTDRTLKDVRISAVDPARYGLSLNGGCSREGDWPKRLQSPIVVSCVHPERDMYVEQELSTSKMVIHDLLGERDRVVLFMYKST
eukprot:scaffold345_cov134-Cylindrotheca_fusiformis.AAC.1